VKLALQASAAFLHTSEFIGSGAGRLDLLGLDSEKLQAITHNADSIIWGNSDSIWGSADSIISGNADSICLGQLTLGISRIHASERGRSISICGH
jgi:hypothetical protein